MSGSQHALYGQPSRRLLFAFILAALVLAPACADSGSEVARFTDPFAYCGEIEDIDAPDERYVGEAVPDAVVEGIRKATGASADAPAEFFRNGISWWTATCTRAPSVPICHARPRPTRARIPGRR